MIRVVEVRIISRRNMFDVMQSYYPPPNDRKTNVTIFPLLIRYDSSESVFLKTDYLVMVWVVY